MEYVFFIVGILFVLFAGVIFNSKEESTYGGGLSLILGIFFLLAGENIDTQKIIPAIEVYRGNTNLIISYNDSIPIDSVVTYKKN